MKRPGEKTAKMLLAVEDGGRWLVVRVHSFVAPDGRRWDAHHGWCGWGDEVSIADVEQNQAHEDEG